MNKNEIIESGLLELYVLGLLDGTELAQVDQAILEFPELKEEIKAIEGAYQKYASLMQLEPSGNLKQEILSNVKSESKPVESKNNIQRNTPSRSYLWPFILTLLTSLALLGAYLFQKGQNRDISMQYEQDQLLCDSLQTAVQQKDIMLAEIANPESKILNVNPTDKYPETHLYIHHNSSTRKNYLQIQNLPEIADNQSYQLWSLKEGQDPVPLDVFETEEGLFEIRFEDNSNAYAITIEKKGGSQVPDLENLIGVIPVS